MSDTGSKVAAAARFAGLGFGLGATVVAAIWLGNQVDVYFGTSPLFLLVFLVAALVGFMQRLLWMLNKKDSR